MQITVLNGVHIQEGSTIRRLQPLSSAVLLVLVSEGAIGPVPTDRLMRLAWEGPSDKAKLHQTMYRLRAVLGGERIISDRLTDTYQFKLQPGDTVDLWTWRELVEICTRRSRSDPHAAVLLWERTLNRWPLSGLQGLSTRRGMSALINNLHAERLRAAEQQAEVQLALGLHSRVSTSLPPLVEHWWRREHLRELLMTALYRDHRGPDALVLYGEYRDRLHQEGLGAPGPALQHLAGQIKANDVALLEVNPPELPSSDRAVIASGADTSQLSVTRMCVAILNDTPASAYTTALDRAACITARALMERLARLEEENQDFCNRLVRTAVIDYNVVRFLELGALPPAWYSAHKVAQLARPDAWVVYANRDVALASYSRDQLQEADGVEFIHGSIRSPRRILEDPDVVRLFQLDKPLNERDPVAIIDRHELNFTSDQYDLKAAYGVLCEEVPPGSLFSITGPVPDGMDPLVEQHLTEVFSTYPTGEVVHYRTGRRLAEIVPDGWEILPPSPADSWRFWPEPGSAGSTGSWRQNSVVAIKR